MLRERDKFRCTIAIRPEWGRNKLAQGKAQRRPGYDVTTLHSLHGMHGNDRFVSPLQGNLRFVRSRTQGGALLCPGLNCVSPLGYQISLARWAIAINAVEW